MCFKSGSSRYKSRCKEILQLILKNYFICVKIIKKIYEDMEATYRKIKGSLRPLYPLPSLCAFLLSSPHNR